jgi:hypothetical protein
MEAYQADDGRRFQKKTLTFRKRPANGYQLPSDVKHQDGETRCTYGHYKTRREHKDLQQQLDTVTFTFRERQKKRYTESRPDKKEQHDYDGVQSTNYEGRKATRIEAGSGSGRC